MRFIRESEKITNGTDQYTDFTSINLHNQKLRRLWGFNRAAITVQLVQSVRSLLVIFDSLVVYYGMFITWITQLWSLTQCYCNM